MANPWDGDTIVTPAAATPWANDEIVKAAPSTGGIARNAAAGALDAAGNVVNIASDPIGNLVGKPLATAAVFAHDALAPYLGYERFPEGTRNMLLGDNVPQPGTRITDAAGAGDVTADTPAERLVRKGVGAAGTGAILMPLNALAPVIGTTGAVVGDQAAQAAPDWAKPAAELAGNVVGGALGVPVAAGIGGLRAGVAGLRRGIENFGNGGDASPAEGVRGAPAVGSGDVPTMTVRPGMGAPEQIQPGMGAAQPTEAAGAQVSTAAEAEMTPQEVAAYRATAEGRKLLETQQPGIRDDRELIPGVAASHAEIEQTVQTARDMKNAGQKVPEVAQQAQEIADANNDTRTRYHEDTIGSPVDINNAKVARDAQGEADRAAAFAHANEAFAEPVLDTAAEIRRSPDGRRPAVRRALDSVTQELAADDQGNLHTDPAQLYGVRKHIDDLLSKEGAATDPLSMRAKSALLRLKDTLDQVIEQAAPGFRQYLDNFSSASRRIDEMQVLQDHFPKLFAANNRMGYAKFQQMMRQIVDSRMNADPISPYKAITDETMERLWRLRDDLRRSASAKELAAAAGSDTAQNMWSAMRSAAGGMGGTAAAAAVGHAVGGPFGGVISGAGKAMLENAMSARTLRRERARGLEMLRGQTRPIDPAPIGRRNPLGPE